MGARCRLVLLVSGLMASSLVQADGDSPCPTAADQKAGERVLVEAEATAATNPAKAFEKLRAIGGRYCFGHGTASYAKAAATVERVGRAAGKAAEQQGRYKDAEQIYREVINLSGAYAEPDMDRAIMGQARAKPGDLSVVSNVQWALNEARESAAESVRPEAQAGRAARLTALDGYLKETRSIAATQGDAALAAEQKAFTSRGGIGAVFGAYPTKELGHAKTWFALADATAMKRALARASERGERLAAEEAPEMLKEAIGYFELAENPAKQQMVKGRAKTLGDAALARKQNQMAVRYYQVAGLSDKADALARRSEMEHEASEAKRKEDFQKGAEDLEKELGF